MKKKIKLFIGEETCLIPELIADVTAEKVLAFTLSKELAGWKDLSPEEQKKLDALYLKDKARVSAYLTERANTTYQHNKDFHDNVNGKGNKGRDYLYLFMEHWAGLVEGKCVRHYDKIMEQWEKVKAYHKAKKDKV
jgi:hypothetical protein